MTHNLIIIPVTSRMESNPLTGEHQQKAPKSRLVKIVDVPFSSVPLQELNGKAGDENGALIKEEMTDGLAKSAKDRTLRKVLLNRDEVVTIERLLVSSSLAGAIPIAY